MNLLILNDTIELNRHIALRVKETLDHKADALLCLAAGESPLGIFEELIKMDLSGEIDFSKSYFVGLDEWIGIGVNNPDSCLNFMDNNLFSQVSIPTANICFFDGESIDPNKECKRVDQFIHSRNGIDFMLLGVGMNGHLGLNEPGVDPGLHSHVIDIQEITREVAQEKYFDLSVALEKGITLGIQQIREAKEVVVLMNGKHKSEIARRILKGNIGNEVPATMVRDHQNITFCLDKDAASLL